MELTADQVLCVLKNLLGEEVLRDLLVRGISTVEIKDTEDILLIIRYYSFLKVIFGFVSEFFNVT